MAKTVVWPDLCCHGLGSCLLKTVIFTSGTGGAPQLRPLPQVLKPLVPGGALVQDDTSGLLLMTARLQVYTSDSIWSDYALRFPAELTLLTLVLGFMHPCSLLLQLAMKSESPLLRTPNLKRVCNCGKPPKALESVSEPPTLSLPLLKKKRSTVFEIWYFFRFFLLEVFLGEPRCVAYASINGTAAV